LPLTVFIFIGVALTARKAFEGNAMRVVILRPTLANDYTGAGIGRSMKNEPEDD
jgi:hypothetical protein